MNFGNCASAIVVDLTSNLRILVSAEITDCNSDSSRKLLLTLTLTITRRQIQVTIIKIKKIPKVVTVTRVEAYRT